MTGIICQYTYCNRSGFIKGDDGNSYYFSTNDCSFKPKHGHIVSFDADIVEESTFIKGLKAIRIKLIGFGINNYKYKELSRIYSYIKKMCPDNEERKWMLKDLTKSIVYFRDLRDLGENKEEKSNE